MKRKQAILFCCLPLIVFGTSCSNFHHHESSSLTVSESEHEYKIVAGYPERNTEKVAHYMNEKLGDKNDLSFIHKVIDSIASYHEVKALGEGLKPFLNK